MKSPISMRKGTFNTSKCRGKLQKMGVLYNHSPKSLGPLPKLPKKISKKISKISKDGTKPDRSSVHPWPADDRWSPAGCRSIHDPSSSVPFFLNFFSSCPPIFAHVVNSCWLAPAYAHLA
jgi:hypothetical protein